MRTLLNKLKIHVNIKSEKKSITIKNLFNAFNSIGKTSKEKDKRVVQRVITTSLVSHHLRKAHLLSKTCLDMNLNCKTFFRALRRRTRVDSPPQNDTWVFSGRLPRVNMKLTENAKDEIQQFWHSNSRVSPNVKDVLMLRIGKK